MFVRSPHLLWHVLVAVQASGHGPFDAATFGQLAVAAARDYIWLPGKGCYGKVASATPSEPVASAQVPNAKSYIATCQSLFSQAVGQSTCRLSEPAITRC